MALPKCFWISSLLLLVVGCSVESNPNAAPPEGMVLLPMQQMDGKSAPALYIDKTEVKVASFAAFVEATQYITEAEEFGWSGVFDHDSLAFIAVEGATWLQPKGPEAPKANSEEPVTQLSLRDVKAYAKWAGKRLPSEEEWLRAASHNGQHLNYPWGEEELPAGNYLGNWWQGPFPIEDYQLDGYPGVAPVGSFPATDLGLYDISGNVWEWTDTAVRGQYIIRGGSFLCSNSYCSGFQLEVKQYTAADSGLNHLGFRCVKDL